MTQALSADRGRIDDGGVLALTGALAIYGLVYSHLATFLTSKAGVPSTPVNLAIFGLGLILASGIFVRRSLTRSSVGILVAVLAYVFILLGSLSFLGEQAFSLTRDRLVWAMVSSGAIILLSNLRSPTLFLLIVRVVILVSAMLVIAEFASGFSLPVVMTTVPGRAAGLFENPNIAALFIPMALPVVTIGLKPVHRMFWYALTLTCVVLTFSRGGLALCALAIVLVEAFPVQRAGVTSLRRLFILALLAVTAVSLYGLISTLLIENFGSELDANTIRRARLEGNASSDIRLYVLRLAWDGFSTSPFWGHGTGAGERWEVQDVSVHNMFGLVALEYGVIGLTWLGGFLLALWSIPRPFGIWAASLFTVASVTTHNLADGSTYAAILATYAALPALFTAPQGHGPTARSRSQSAGGRRLLGPTGHP